MTCPFVRMLIERDVVESTNDLARELAIAGTVELPLAIRAARQTRGRGRGVHAWWSDAGSLTFSVLLDPAAHGLRVADEPKLALATAVALIEATSGDLPPGAAGIRWPNDVEAGGKKLAGILPERVATPSGPRLVIGVGLNVLTRIADAPDEVRRLATSVADLSTNPLTSEDVDRLFRAILEQFTDVLGRLVREDPALPMLWDRLDRLRDRRVRVDLGPRIVSGIGRGIDPDGALVLAGETEVFRLFGGQVFREG
jgi:BirA family transcriptional regulator, biotin operon repressor / biotin---[acetyl-CoA-carboxylase] ligase